MNIERITKAWFQAQRASEQLGTYSPSLDALFVAAYLDADASPTRSAQRKTSAAPPAWFVSKVNALGECAATAATIMRLATGEEPSAGQARQCGIWLRAMGFAPYKSNGTTKFKLAPN